MEPLYTPRLLLLPMTLGMVEAVLLGRREEAEAMAAARMPARWPNRELVERAFSVTLEDVRARPEERLWGARVVLANEGANAHANAASSANANGAPSAKERRVVGSVVFKGKPCGEGACEIAYGIEEGSQGCGFATEAVGASMQWAHAQPEVRSVRASTLPWHRASIRVLEKVGMMRVGTFDHETLGEVLVYESRR